jgi:hypothetical protein
MSLLTWYTGKNSYRKLTLEVGEQSNLFTMEMLEHELYPFNTIHDVFAYHIEGANLPVEILYSGGMDSELSLISCLKNKIPVIAVTMRLMLRGCPVNTHDLYYAEKFCRDHGVTQKIVDLAIESFLGNGDYARYLSPYLLTQPNVASHMWLAEQCTNFPIIGGDYIWPQLDPEIKTYSPNRNEFAFYDVFMKDNGIDGIGNMLSHSLESTVWYLKEHINLYNLDPAGIAGDTIRIIDLKLGLAKTMGYGDLDRRHKSYGWELLGFYKEWLDVPSYRKEMLARNHSTKSIVKWNEMLGSLIGRGPGENDSYGYKTVDIT